MYAFEVKPAFRGRSYSDALQLVDATTGGPLKFVPTDILTWRLTPLDRYQWGRWGGWDYGFQPGNDADLWRNGASLLVLTIGSGLTLGVSGVAGWSINEGQTLRLCKPEYRMTVDLTRAGQTVPLLDTTLQVMD